MVEYAPPATRYGFFHCNGIFWPDVGNSNRHERAKISTLKSLLQPPAPQPPKSGKRNIPPPPPPPDPAGHWYEAQCLHYGLNPSKNKQVAKKRLQEALQADTLALPVWVATLEDELKKEWGKANKLAEARAKKEKLENEGSKAGSKVEIAKKEYEKALREQEAAKCKPLKRATTKPSLTNENIGKPASKKEPLSKNETAKKDPPKKAIAKKAAVKEPIKPSTKRPYSDFVEDALGTQEAPTPVRKKQTARCSLRSRYSNVSSRPRPSNGQGTPSLATDDQSSTSSRAKQTARRSRSNYSNVGSRPRPSTGPVSFSSDSENRSSTSVRPKQTARRSNNSNFASRPRPPAYQSKPEDFPSGDEYGDPMDVDDDNEVSSNRSSITQNTDEIDSDVEFNVTGVYRIEAPVVTEEWGHTNLKLMLRLDQDILWGAYDFGICTGIIRAQPGPTRYSRTPVNFLWRGRETGEGMMSFGNSCVGHLTFLHDGRIEGEMNAIWGIKFTGQRRPGPKNVIPRSSAHMKYEWDGYNEQEYERERVGRWH